MNSKVVGLLVALAVAAFAAPAAQARPLMPAGCPNACTSDGVAPANDPNPACGVGTCDGTSDGNPGNPGCAGSCGSTDPTCPPSGCDSTDPTCPPSGCDSGDPSCPYGCDPQAKPKPNPQPQPIQCHSAHVGDEKVSEGDGKVTFRISAGDSDPQCRLKVGFRTVDEDATDGLDYRGGEGSVTLKGGQDAKVDVTILEDKLDEDDERFRLELDGDSKGSGESTIADNDLPPSIAAGDATVVEGNGPGTKVLVPVTLSGASGRTITVDYATVPGSAAAGSDFTPATGTLTFAPGETAETVPVAVVGDTTPESPETFALKLSAPQNATIAPGQDQVTIANDDAAPVTVGSHNSSETSGGPADQPHPQQPLQLLTGADAAGPAIGLSQPAQHGGVVEWTVRCPKADQECVGSVRIALLGRPQGKSAIAAKSAAPLVLGVQRYRLKGGQHKKLRVKLNRRGRRLLRKRHVLKVKATFTTRDSSGNKARRTQVFRLHEVAFRHN